MSALRGLLRGVAALLDRLGRCPQCRSRGLREGCARCEAIARRLREW